MRVKGMGKTALPHGGGAIFIWRFKNNRPVRSNSDVLAGQEVNGAKLRENAQTISLLSNVHFWGVDG
jgi:hypothetical protein